MLSKVVILPQVRVALKFAPWIVIIGLAIGLYFTRATLADARKVLKAEADFRGQMQVELSAKSADRTDLLHRANAVVKESENRRALLAQISKDTLDAKARADQADAALRQEQADNARKFQVAQRTIKDLQSRKSTGDLARDMEIISRDSGAPWRAWK